MHDVMISYSSKDKIIADAICNQLESNRIRVWIAPRDLVGRTYPTGIKDGIENCSIIVLVFTTNSNISQWVHRELERGVNHSKIIIPFKLEEVNPLAADIEMCTCNQHWIDAITPPIEKNIQILVSTISRLLLGDIDDSSSNNTKQFKRLSPLGEIYQLTDRWVQSNYQYYILEGIGSELKSMLRTAPQSINVNDENVSLFMMIASVHFGGAWNYWQKKIKNSEEVIKQLINVLKIPYLRPRLRSLYALQFYESNLLKKELYNTGINLDQSLEDLLQKFVFTKKVDIYLNKLKKHKDSQIASKAAIVIEEIEYYESDGKNSKTSSMPLV